MGVAFFEYADMMTQQQARAALEGLELGSKRLSVKKPEEVIESGLVSRFQKLGTFFDSVRFICAAVFR